MKSYLKCHTDGFLRVRRFDQEDKLGEQFVTEGNTYEVIDEYEDEEGIVYVIVDDQGDEHEFTDNKLHNWFVLVEEDLHNESN